MPDVGNPAQVTRNVRQNENMNQNEFEIWNRDLRLRVIDYLQNEGIESPQVGDWPAFDVAPHFGIWCVESKKVKGKIGWWAFAGDCPTDYVLENGKCHPREALGDLLARWKECIPLLKSGQQPSGMKFGDGSNPKLLGELLETRVGVLVEWLNDDDIWN